MNVLLVSRDEGLVRAAGRSLKGRGHRVKVRRDLATARELLAERRPSLVVVDLDVGRDTAIALLSQLRASLRHQDTPAVVTSALLRAGTPFVERCLHELGAACFMERPVPDGDWPLVLERVFGGEIFGEQIRSVTRTAGSLSSSGTSRRQSSARRLLKARQGGGRTGGSRRRPDPDEQSTWSVSQVVDRSRPSSGPSRSSSSSTARRIDLEDPESLLLRLRRELTILATVPDRGALAMPADAPVRKARRYASRMKLRYNRYAEPATQPEEVVSVALDILARIDQALERLTESSSPTSASSTVSSVGPQRGYDELMALGRTALHTGRNAQALACFRGARSERPGEAEPLAWLGWAMAMDSRRPRDQRLAEAVEYLRLADQFDPSLAEGQLFLARLELELGDREVARARLQRLLRNHPGHREARKLLGKS